MPDTDDATHRLRYRATGEDIRVREPEEVDSENDVFEVRLPIATTGQVRNDGDDPLTRSELNGMARQLREREIGVFPAHGGDTMIAAGRYSPFEKLGAWQDASIDAREDENVLLATARMPDPETLPAATGEYRKALAILKEQAKRGIAQDASIGWRDDEDFQGGVDLMEASIVGIGADWRTNTGDEQAEVVARAAVEAGADPDELVASVREAVESERPLGPPGDEDRFESFDECVDALSEDSETSREDAKEICGAWENAKDEQSHDMTEDTDTDTTDEQDADTDESAETQDDAPDAVRQSPSELSDLAEDIVMGHVEQAMDEFENAVAEMLDGEEGDGEEAEMDGDDEEDDDEMDEQSADGADTDERDTSDLEERLAELESELEDAREGGLSTEDVADTEPESERESEGGESDETDEQRDTTDDAVAPDPTGGLGDYRTS
jgi:hypothetical protein